LITAVGNDLRNVGSTGPGPEPDPDPGSKNGGRYINKGLDVLD
jgi:hypothetical protein